MTSKGKALLFVVVVFLLFFTIGNGLVGTVRSGGSIKDILPKRSAQVFLIAGVDARENETVSRADTIILVFLHPQNNTVDLLFVPRDSRVRIAGDRYPHKINSAHSKGGVLLLKGTLEETINVDIKGFVQVDFEGFKRIIDTLGGVEIDVEKRMYYPAEKINIREGKQRLNGYDSLAYVRYRSDGLGDIGRVERQRKFLRELAVQSVSLRTLIKSPQIIDELIQYTNTDLKVTQIIKIAGRFVGQPEIRTHILPGRSQTINGGSYWVIDEEQAKSLVKQLKAGLPSD